MSVNGGSATTIARNDNGSVSSYLPVNMTFDANGNAPFTFNYSDAGQVTLHASKAAGGSLLSALTGASNAFVVKPHHFDLSAIMCTTADAANCAPGALPSGNNPGAANAAGASFIQAGSLFSVTVTARTFGGSATPNYGQETSPEGVRLDRTLVDPTGAGTNNPAVAYTAGFGAFTNGVATGTDFQWNEVGIITLTPGIGDGNYLGAGDVTGTTSVNVGRFIPAYFDVAYIDGCTGAATFTYSGQPFTATVTACAAGSPCSTTSNYHGLFGFAKATTISNAGDDTNFSNNTIAAGNFSFGIRNQIDVTYTFPTPPGKDVVPLTLTLRATEDAPGGDGVTSASGPAGSEDPAEIRSGRLRLINAYGSELVLLSVPMRVEYYSSDGWITNAADTCTVLNGTILDLENNIDDPGEGSNTIIIKSPQTSLVTVVSPAPATGTGELLFSKPDADGYADASMNLSAQPWLQYDWDGDSTEDDPVGRATFGLYRGSPRHIYQRERY
jgi:MSHA biogenesis protein MshQ